MKSTPKRFQPYDANKNSRTKRSDAVAAMNLDGKGTAQTKFLAYEASLGFLKGACNADRSMNEEARMLQVTMDDCIASMATDSVVSAIAESLECRKRVLEFSNRIEVANDPNLRTAMRADEKRIAAFLVSVFSSKTEEQTALRLEGDSAQHFLDVVQEMLDRGFLMKQEHTRMAFRLIRKLSESCDRLPSSLFIVGVNNRDEYPVCGGGFGDIYHASYGDQRVALKRMRYFLRHLFGIIALPQTICIEVKIIPSDFLNPSI
ncbi:hypothetical protein K438DRAFT_1980100 [Mycena galopus ATCC 62051]|nr:hypothetical protein K438DRAFT_1980100 [Mycena galopus ATCC 62051]